MPSISLENVSVSFPIYSAVTRSLKNRLIQTATGGQICSESGSDKVSIVQALLDVNLQLRSGDRIGLVGHNGAGKTTLLRVLAGIYQPNRGHVAVEGWTVPLFDIGLGMDPESTGYENILLRGLYLGLTRAQIRARLDEIAEFTELGDFLNLPLRTYSTGMRMRLAFAVSTSVAPDILLIDEGIGAGDAAFLQKANQRLKLFTEQVSIIVLSSHSEALINQMCQKAILMQHGRVVCGGTTAEVFAQYRAIRNGTPPASAAPAKAVPAVAGAAAPASAAPAKAVPAVAGAAAPVGAAPEQAPPRSQPPEPSKVASATVISATTGATRVDQASAPVGLKRESEGFADLSTLAQTLARQIDAHGWTDGDLEYLVKQARAIAEQDRLIAEARLVDLLLQLLIWHYRLSERARPRRDLIDEARRQLERLIESNQAMMGVLQSSLGGAYQKAIAAAARYLDMNLSLFPQACPVGLSQLLDRSWVPGNPITEDRVA